jgi:hypothetical protein
LFLFGSGSETKLLCPGLDLRGKNGGPINDYKTNCVKKQAPKGPYNAKITMLSRWAGIIIIVRGFEGGRGVY